VTRVPPAEEELRDILGAAVAKTLEAKLLGEIREAPVPRHVAIIMDGNRRFAHELGLDPLAGHDIGRDTLERVLDWCLEVGVRYLTVYAFSTENFGRSSSEVAKLMALFEENFRKMADDERVHKHEIQIRAIGQTERLPREVQDAIAYAESRTRAYDRHHYTIAIAYGGREEILRAVRSLAGEVARGRLRPEDIDESVVAKHLYTGDLPDPDLILRTSGEERISNFLLWQIAYSELYFTDVYWPGFRRIDFLRAIRTYQLRQRRYGK
jgi:tritrans,polycis-undecaprenyl-diphosphate synthase [geranylgeranyl-diphosphate specific]